MPVRDLQSQRFGKLYVIAQAETTSAGKARWHYVCDCGKAGVVQGNNLTNGHTTSCGCQRAITMRRVQHDHSYIHGHNIHNNTSRTHNSWNAMIERCTNPKHVSYHRYGAKGITVCPAWFDFPAFLHDMGERPEGMTLDRIRNKEGYKPDNCRWATPQQQTENRG